LHWAFDQSIGQYQTARKCQFLANDVSGRSCPCHASFSYRHFVSSTYVVEVLFLVFYLEVLKHFTLKSLAVSSTDHLTYDDAKKKAMNGLDWE